MSSEPPVSPLTRLAHRPVPVLMGIVAGFLACCIAGRLAARQQPFENFVRFHPGTAPDSHYYPPFSQVLNLARQRALPGKVMVLIGGNSILNGVGQREAQIWTRRLQELLGDDYTVLNLALRGNWSHEFGGLIAERLVAEGEPVIFVTTSLEPGASIDWDGNHYRYFFWDAWGKGLLPPDDERDQWLDDTFFKMQPTGSPGRELRYRGLVDGTVYACDLWNTVAYQYLGTVFSPLKYPRFWEAHRKLPDSDPGETLPFEIQNREGLIPAEHNVMLRFARSPLADALLRGESNERATAPYRFIPSTLVDRTLLVYRLGGVYYRERLPPEDLERYLAYNRLVPQVVARNGFHTQLVGEGYTIRDYSDASHFSEPGGRKVAEELAPTIQKMAARLYGTRIPDPGGRKP
jgi:lysophospholipase L1-like esterase